MLVIMPASKSAKVGFLSSARRQAQAIGRASCRLHRALAQAATATGTDVEVPGAVKVALPGGGLLVPDIVVVTAGPVG